MKKLRLSSMSVDELEKHLEYLAKSSLQEGAWEAAANAEAGIKLRQFLSAELAVVQSSYRTIPAHLPEAPFILAGLQGEERRILFDLSRLGDSENRKKSVDEEVGFVKQLIVQKRKLER